MISLPNRVQEITKYLMGQGLHAIAHTSCGGRTVENERGDVGSISETTKNPHS